MPTRPEGVYQDSGGAWYFKVTVGRDPLTGRREQITRRGFRTATEARRPRREVLEKKDSGRVRPAPKLLTVDELLDLYLDGLDGDGALGAKTRFDYRNHVDAYVRPWLGKRKVRDITPEVILTWQRKLTQGGGTKLGKALKAGLARVVEFATTLGYDVVAADGKSRDSEARLARKSNATAAKLCLSGHTLMENRNGLLVDAELSEPSGYAERDVAIDMLARLPKTDRRRTVGADKGYDTAGFVAAVRDLNITPHVAQHTNQRRSAIDGRTTRHDGHEVSMRIRKRIEEPFGWVKTVGGGRKIRYKGRQRNRAWFLITAAVYSLIRIVALDAAIT